MEQDGQLLVRLEDGRLADSKGQRVFDFAEEASATTLDIKQNKTSPGDWFLRGREFEEAGDLGKAAAAYQQALLAGGPEATTCFNLANVLHEMGQIEQAVKRYRQAVELNYDFAEAWNNMGIALSDLSQRESACKAYEKALSLDPLYANARFNLADLLDEWGKAKEARFHWQIYAKQDSKSTWGTYAKQQVAKID
jgi:superkiller protein 3